MVIDELIKFTQKAKANGLYPKVHTIDGPSSNPIIKIGNAEFLSFSTNNYLGIAQRSELKKAAKDNIDKYGIGPCSVRLMSGNFEVYQRLEEATARFLGFEDTIIFSSGYMANIGIIQSVVNSPYAGAFTFFKKRKPAIIISDELNHASIVDGCRLANTEKYIFKHNDCDHLLKLLKEYKDENKLVIVEGIYSMDGDIAPLDKIVELAKSYKAMLMVDDAHATGILGKNGKGTFEQFGIAPDDIDLLMGTYVKAFGSVGGFVCAKKDIIDYLKVASRSFIFSICIAPSMAEAAIKALELVQNEPELRNRLFENINYLKKNLDKRGLNTLSSESPIIPIIIGKEKNAIQLEKLLFSKGLFVPCIRWPAVDRGMSRLRISVSAYHDKEHMDRLLSFIDKHLDLFPRRKGLVKATA